MRVTMLQDQIDDKTEKLEDINKRIKELESEVPPPASVCDTLTSCDTCTANKGCVYCVAEEKCVAGNEDGPTQTSCSFFNWDKCTASGCSRYKDCNSCISDPMCGFCSQNNQCLQEDADFGGCVTDSWYHSLGSLNQCPLGAGVGTENPLNEGGEGTKSQAE